MIKKINILSVKRNNKNNTNGGFSLVELIVVVAIMAILVAIMTPSLLTHLHKARVAADWSNLKTYYDEIQADYTTTGEYNSKVPTTDYIDPDSWKLTEVKFLDGQVAKMKGGYYAITKDTSGKGYHISYYCNSCLKDWDKHGKTCALTLGA